MYIPIGVRMQKKLPIVQTEVHQDQPMISLIKGVLVIHIIIQILAKIPDIQSMVGVGLKENHELCSYIFIKITKHSFKTKALEF